MADVWDVLLVSNLKAFAKTFSINVTKPKRADIVEILNPAMADGVFDEYDVIKFCAEVKADRMNLQFEYERLQFERVQLHLEIARHANREAERARELALADLGIFNTDAEVPGNLTGKYKVSLPETSLKATCEQKVSDGFHCPNAESRADARDLKKRESCEEERVSLATPPAVHDREGIPQASSLHSEVSKEAKVSISVLCLFTLDQSFLVKSYQLMMIVFLKEFKNCDHLFLYLWRRLTATELVYANLSRILVF